MFHLTINVTSPHVNCTSNAAEANPPVGIGSVAGGVTGKGGLQGLAVPGELSTLDSLTWRDVAQAEWEQLGHRDVELERMASLLEAEAANQAKAEEVCVPVVACVETQPTTVSVSAKKTRRGRRRRKPNEEEQATLLVDEKPTADSNSASSGSASRSSSPSTPGLVCAPCSTPSCNPNGFEDAATADDWVCGLSVGELRSLVTAHNEELIRKVVTSLLPQRPNQVNRMVDKLVKRFGSAAPVVFENPSFLCAAWPRDKGLAR